MKIRNEIKRILSGCKIMISKYNIYEEKQFEDSFLSMSIPIKLGDFKQVKCDICSEINEDWCWNCEKPVCEKHSFAIITPMNIINTLCGECKEEILKECKEEILKKR